MLERNPGRHSRDDCEGASATGQKKNVTIIPTERSRISLSSCLERIKSLKSDFFYVVAICLDEILKVSIFSTQGKNTLTRDL